MTALLITSLHEYAGKTMLCAGLGQYWIDSGRKVGYFSPCFSESEMALKKHKSLSLLRHTLGLTESAEALYPLLPVDSAAVQAAFAAVSRGVDMMVIEGSYKHAELLSSAVGARILIVHYYASDLSKALPEYIKLAGKLAGVVLNKVPAKKLPSIVKASEGTLAKAGLKLLGVIPENRILSALSVGDLAEALDGKILNNPEKSTDLIENLMLGSSTFDRGAAYYQRKNNKAVIVWGERPGYRKAALAALPQLALQTSTRCVVICDAAVPLPAILQKAEEKGVPLVSVPGKLPEVIIKLEKAVAATFFAQEQKISPLSSVLSAALNPRLLAGDFNIG